MERSVEMIDRDRRRYLARLAATIAGAGLGVFGVAQAIDRESREFSGLDRATEWINSPRLTAASLSGKVVLVDFWTYTCINWLRTLPYMRAWAQKYRQQLVVIGVHTPEFPFEHDIDNVRRAVRQVAIEYPVAIDNDYAIWRAFRNQYWPALFFVDARGRIRDHHFGEGKYEQLERTTQKLLAEAGTAAPTTTRRRAFSRLARRPTSGHGSRWGRRCRRQWDSDGTAPVSANQANDADHRSAV